MLFIYPWASIKDVQGTGEAVNHQKRTTSTSKDEISSLFSIIVGNFALLDPDPVDQCGSGLETLVLGKNIMQTIMLMSKMVHAFFCIERDAGMVANMFFMMYSVKWELYE